MIQVTKSEKRMAAKVHESALIMSFPESSYDVNKMAVPSKITTDVRSESLAIVIRLMVKGHQGHIISSRCL